MASQTAGTLGRRALLISPLVIVVVCFFAVLFWMKPKSAGFVLILSAVCSIFVMAYAAYLARRMQRHMDEVQLASQGFASVRAMTWGMAATIVLLMLPPVTNRLIDLADVMTAGASDPTTRHRAAVLLGLYMGFMLVALLQTACSFIAATIWWRRMASP